MLIFEIHYENSEEEEARAIFKKMLASQNLNRIIFSSYFTILASFFTLFFASLIIFQYVIFIHARLLVKLFW